MNIQFPASKKLEELSELRSRLSFGDNTSQEEVDSICEEWGKYRESLRPGEKDEIFTLVDTLGNSMNLKAPRWLCHLLGLRHRSVHVLLQWMSESLGNVFVLQMRSWAKSDSPGQLDISVGGHVVVNGDAEIVESVYREMEEELGVTKTDLFEGELLYEMGYENEYEKRIENHFYNKEWRDVYLGKITTSAFNKVRFNDNEVVGLYFCPESQAWDLLNQKLIPLASALRESLPKCLEKK